MSAQARLQHFDTALAHIKRARALFANHLNLVGEQLVKFAESGSFVDDLRDVGDQCIQESPWLYFVLGGIYGPYVPKSVVDGSGNDTLRKEARDWADFFSRYREEKKLALSYLYMADGCPTAAVRHLEKSILIARKYETYWPTRIEVVWPQVLLGDCYWASGQQEKAVVQWRRASSIEMCVVPDLDEGDRLGIPWIGKARTKLAEYHIPVPNPEASQEASRRLRRAINLATEAEGYEDRSGSTHDLAASVIRGGSRYVELLNMVANELDAVTGLDPFAWARQSDEKKTSWIRRENLKDVLMQKMAMVHLVNDRTLIAISCYKQALEAWPTLFVYFMMGKLQADCGLRSDAIATFRLAISHAEEVSASESSEESSLILEELRRAIQELS